MRMLLSGNQRSRARPCPFYRSGAASQAASVSSPASQHLAPAVRAAARPLRAHETGLRPLPGALCVTTVTTGSQPEPSVLVVHSSPDLVVAQACQSCAGTMAERQMSKYQQHSIRYQQCLSTNGPLFKLAAGRGAGAELNNENN